MTHPWHSTAIDDWYVFHGTSCHGPFSKVQMQRLILAKKIDAKALLRRGDWDCWRPVFECVNALADDDGARKAMEPFKSERRVAAPRIPVSGTIEVVAECGGQLIGATKDISVSGIFMLTTDPSLKIGADVSVIARTAEFKEPVLAAARVRRFNLNPSFPVGYGLEFVGLDNKLIVAISKMVGYRPLAEFGDVLARVPAAIVPAAG